MPTPKLNCPYNGTEMTLVFSDNIPHTGWYMTGGFDPSVPFLSREAGEAAFKRRDGKADGISVPTCAYTGKPVAFMQKGRLWYAIGEFFRPCALVSDKEMLEYNLRRRAGKAAGKPPKAVKVVVGEERVYRANPAEGLGGKGSEVTDLVKEFVK